MPGYIRPASSHTSTSHEPAKCARLHVAGTGNLPACFSPLHKETAVDGGASLRLMCCSHWREPNSVGRDIPHSNPGFVGPYVPRSTRPYRITSGHSNA